MFPQFVRYWKTFAVFLLAAGVIALALSGYLGGVIKTTISPIINAQSWFYTRYQAIYDFVTVPRDVASLGQRNAQLEEENAQLRTQLIEMQQQLREAEVLYALLDFARARPDDVYVASAVIGRDPSPFLHYLIIGHGSDDGLRHGMPVVTQQGLVGRIDAVTAGAARVQLISDANSSVNIYLQSTESSALMKGSITGDMLIEMISQDVVVQPGELVLTSGLGGSYPPDVLVGQIVSVRNLGNELFQSASIQPAVDFSSLRAVLVITNFKPVDISPLIPEQNP
jgi:rod shape-determining protein MreC